MAKGPQLPSRADPELYAYLKFLRDRLSRAEQRLGLSSDVTDSGLPSASGEQGFDPVAETSVLLVDQGTRPAVNAYQTISAGAPADARWAKIQFRIKTTSDANIAGLYYKDADGAEVLTVDCDDDQNDGQPVYWDFVKLDASGNFQYNMLLVGLGTEPDWQILRVGYVL